MLGSHHQRRNEKHIGYVEKPVLRGRGLSRGEGEVQVEQTACLLREGVDLGCVDLLVFHPPWRERGEETTTYEVVPSP